MHISIRPEELFQLGPLTVTNSLLTSWISAIVLMVAGVLVGKTFKRLPSGLQHAFEMAYELFENLAQSTLGKDGSKFVPFALTLFLFILTSNWIGILPGVGSLGFTRDGEFVPLFRGGNADLNTTLALALIAMVTVHAVGVRSSGWKAHLSHFKNPLEIISELSKILSFSFRLFGNIFAGEVLLFAMISILAIITANQQPLYGVFGGVIAVPFVLFELFVGFIQAFVFSVLTLSFIGLFYKAGHH